MNIKVLTFSFNFRHIHFILHVFFHNFHNCILIFVQRTAYYFYILLKRNKKNANEQNIAAVDKELSTVKNFVLERASNHNLLLLLFFFHLNGFHSLRNNIIHSLFGGVERLRRRCNKKQRK